MSANPSSEFTCDRCGVTQISTNTDEEALAEAQGLFGPVFMAQEPDRAVLCDSCFAEFLSWAQGRGYVQGKGIN